VYREILPCDAPPTYRGQLLKYAYKITIGTQRLGSPTKLLRVPIRVIVLRGLSEACVYSESGELAPTNPFLHTPHRDTPRHTALQIIQKIEEIIEGHRETLTDGELAALVRADEEDDGDDEEQEAPACWDIHKFSEVFQVADHLKNLVSEYDPSMERSINFALGLTSVMALYKNMFRQLKKQQRQLPITMFFKKTSASISSADQPMPSTSHSCNDLSHTGHIQCWKYGPKKIFIANFDTPQYLFCLFSNYPKL
ncbi:RAB6A-GEF complex partner protein 2-like 1, partial [Homarus americanus]